MPQSGNSLENGLWLLTYFHTIFHRRCFKTNYHYGCKPIAKRVHRSELWEPGPLNHRGSRHQSGSGWGLSTLPNGLKSSPSGGLCGSAMDQCGRRSVFYATGRWGKCSVVARMVGVDYIEGTSLSNTCIDAWPWSLIEQYILCLAYVYYFKIYDLFSSFSAFSGFSYAFVGPGGNKRELVTVPLPPCCNTNLANSK